MEQCATVWLKRERFELWANWICIFWSCFIRNHQQMVLNHHLKFQLRMQESKFLKAWNETAVSESHFDDKVALHRRPVVSILFFFSSVMVTKHVCFLSFVLFYPMCCLENEMKGKIRKEKLFSSPLHADIYRTVTPSDLWLTSAVLLLFRALAPSVMEASGVKQKLK